MQRTTATNGMRTGRQRRLTATLMPRVRAGLIAQLFLLPLSHAAEIESSLSDLKLRWDNTIKYSTMFRLKGRDEALVRDPNQDDANRNFDKGLVSNRVDLLTEFDATYRNFGLRLSGAAWYDGEYNKANDNDSFPSTLNAFGVAHNRFPERTRKYNGRKGDLLDAFISGRFEVAEMPVTFRLGRHALIWGESVFFGSNGIAAGQAPIDVNKALAVPNLRFNELIRPDNQVSGQIQLSPDLALAGYYKLSWEENRMPGAGSYFASIAPDFVLPGSDMLYAPGHPEVFLRRAADLEPGHTHQGGVSVKYRVPETDLDLGFYAVQYNSRSFQVVIMPGRFSSAPLAPNQVGEYRLAYHKGIKTYGVSASTSVGNVNFAGEVSVRRNLDLVNGSVVDPLAATDNDQRPGYGVGNSLQAQFSWLASLGPSFISTEGTWIGEIAWNRRTSISANPNALDPNSTREAWALRTIYEPTYRQALPGWDVSVPLSLGYTTGRSSVVGGFGAHKGGDMTVGINGTYLDAWRVSMNYTHYYGKSATFLAPITMANQTFLQPLKDRDYISLSVRRTF